MPRRAPTSPITRRFASYDLSFPRILEDIGRAHCRKTLEVFRGFLTLAACTLGAGTREPEYLEEDGRWPQATVIQFAHALAALTLDAERYRYHDLLGPVYMEWGSRWDHSLRGEFYTPSDVAYLMGQMALAADSPPTDRPVTLLEPCCGAGAMILGYAHALADRGIPVSRTLVTAIDLSYDACQMTLIQCSLHSIPARIIRADSLQLGHVPGYTPLGVWHTPFWPANDRTPDFAAPIVARPSTPSQLNLALPGAAPGPES